MKLFFAPNSIAVATALALNEAGLDYESIRVNFAEAEQTKPEFLVINPKGRVPALVTDQGILTETGALLDYVSVLAPDAGLIPNDPFTAAQVRSMVHYLASTMHVNHAHKMRGHRWANTQTAWDDMAAKVPETMTASCAFVEEHIQGPLLFGAEPTIADCHLFAISRWVTGDGVNLDDFPNLTTFMATLQARPSMQKLAADGIIT
ncbi:MAG: glutathione S-transferase family protein [Marinovum sp.]|nr:glutathione S-transferase family protein [Marinovum sp.]